MVEEEQAYAALAAGKHLWRRHYVGDREFWRRAGMDPVSGQWYTKEEKDASICSALPDAGVDAVVSPAKNEGTADANRAWFDMHWALMASVVPASMAARRGSDHCADGGEIGGGECGAGAKEELAAELEPEPEPACKKLWDLMTPTEQAAAALCAADLPVRLRALMRQPACCRWCRLWQHASFD